MFSQTFSQREKRQQLQEKRKALLDARLAKVRQRKLRKQQEQGGTDQANEGGGGEEENRNTTSENLTDFNFDVNEKSMEDGGRGSEVSALLAAELKLAQEKAKKEEEEREEEKRATHVRPWDKGKGIGLHVHVVCSG